MREGYVYIVQSLQFGWIKIGWAKDVARRMVDVAAMTGSDLRLIAARPGTQADETDVLRSFAHLRIAYDWFIAGDDLLDCARTWSGAIVISFVGSSRRGQHGWLCGRLARASGGRRGPHADLVFAASA